MTNTLSSKDELDDTPVVWWGYGRPDDMDDDAQDKTWALLNDQ